MTIHDSRLCRRMKRRQSLSIGDDIQITYEGFTPPGTDIGWRGKPYTLTEASIMMVISDPNKRPWQISLKPGETKGIWESDFGNIKEVSATSEIMIQVSKHPRPQPSAIRVEVLAPRAIRITQGRLWERRLPCA
jgi:hypothetical protein